MDPFPCSETKKLFKDLQVMSLLFLLIEEILIIVFVNRHPATGVLL